MSHYTAAICSVVWLITIVSAQPTELQAESGTTFNPFSPDFKWTKYNIAALTTAGVVVGTGLALLATLFFPMFVYKICYALGGCQNTLDNYVDHFIGVEGNTRKVKRDVKNENDMDLIMSFLKMAMQKYGSQTNEKPERENIMKLTKASSDHQIDKRSPIDYIEPVLVMVSKAYNEYVDPELKKNFKKPPSIR